jgi:1-deoxy-D-xylulose-5-phosphate reductoisomerase
VGGAAPVVLNAANEVAVAALLAQKLRYVDIAPLIARCLDDLQPPAPRELAEVLEIDALARRHCAATVARGLM